MKVSLFFVKRLIAKALKHGVGPMEVLEAYGKAIDSCSHLTEKDVADHMCVNFGAYDWEFPEVMTDKDPIYEECPFCSKTFKCVNREDANLLEAVQKFLWANPSNGIAIFPSTGAQNGDKGYMIQCLGGEEGSHLGEELTGTNATLKDALKEMIKSDEEAQHKALLELFQGTVIKFKETMSIDLISKLSPKQQDFILERLAQIKVMVEDDMSKKKFEKDLKEVERLEKESDGKA